VSASFKIGVIGTILTPMTTPPLKPVRTANVQQVLATQRDLHVRQRELVRASLTLCPGKPPRQPAR
jgi:hypothetical protein